MISRTLWVRENIRHPGGIGALLAGPPDLLRGHYLGCRSGDLAQAEAAHLLEASEQPRASPDGLLEAMPGPDPDRSQTPSEPMGTRWYSVAQYLVRFHGPVIAKTLPKQEFRETFANLKLSPEVFSTVRPPPRALEGSRAECVMMSSEVALCVQKYLCGLVPPPPSFSITEVLHCTCCDRR